MPKITTSWKLNIKTPEVIHKMDKAVGAGLLDTVTAIHADAIKWSPHLTGNNKRSLTSEVGPGKEIAKEKGTAAVYSTSGYGGFLETGTVRMPARPYMKPALDKHIKNLTKRIREHAK